MNERFNDKLLAIVNQLLDLGKRNRLLNYRDTGLKTLKILNTNVDEIFRGIKDHKEYTFFKTDSYVNQIQNEFKVDPEDPSSLRELDRRVYEATNEALDKNQLLAYKRSYPLDKVLKGLMKEFKTSITEKGINSLYLSFGFVHYVEEETEFIAPLLLIPADLDNETGDYILTQYEDDVLLNPTLKYYFKTLFNVEMPDYHNDALQTYISKCEDVLPPEIFIEKSCALGIYSFYKMNMYNDLKQNQDIVIQNANIRALLGDSNALTEENLKEAEIFPVVNCDSSQLHAIELAAMGKSFCLQGPPGSGKSQTITNMISSMLGNGKKILFVSEKIAALNVVYENLRRAKLNDFAIELHSNKANKKEFIANLYRTATLPRYDVDFKTRFLGARYESIKVSLKQYEQELHQFIPALDVTLADLYSMYLNTDAEPLDFDVVVENKNLYDLESAFNALMNYVSFTKTTNRDYRKSAFYGLNKIDSQYMTFNFNNDLDASIHLLDQMNEFKEKLYSITRSLPINSITDATKVILLISKLIKLKTYNQNYLNSKARERVINALDSYLATTKTIDAKYFDIYDKKIINEDLESLLFNYKKNNTGLFKNKEFKEINEKILSYRLDKAKVKPDDIIHDLEALIKIKKNILISANFASTITKFYGTMNGLDIKQALMDLRSINTSSDYNLTEEDFKRIVNAFNPFPVDMDRFKLECANLASLSKIFYIKKYNIFEVPLAEITDHIHKISEERNDSEIYQHINKTVSDLNKYDALEFLHEYLDSGLPLSDLPFVYKKSFLAKIIKEITNESKVLKDFTSLTEDEMVDDFRELDEKLLNINRDYIISLNSQKRPDETVIEGSQFKILSREFEKKTRQLPIRTLLEQIFELVLDIKPVFLMSPLSVSTYLASKLNMFDVVIFDEASQIFASDALGAIYRAKQCIVIGDTKQMPPTSFFQADFGMEDEELDLESILDKASYTFDMTALKWHYRSRSEELITFSNQSFYDNNLITIPQSKKHETGFGIDFCYIEDGVYDAQARTNPIEAKRICDMVFDHFKNSTKSLGVVAFSNTQAELIQSLVEKQRMKNPEFEKWFDEESDEPFFVKNLETVQGDERDRIIFSICYGYNKEGKFYQRFGPLNNVGGERRLNVAVTRAKYNITVVSSIQASDISTDNTNSLGVALLKQYLEFANNVNTAKNFNESENGIVNSIKAYLESLGYSCLTNYGSSSFKVDIAVKKGDDFVMAIMLDSQNEFKSNLTDKYRLEKLLLERLGWRYFKLYSTAWVNEQEEEKKRLKEALENEETLEDKRQVLDEDISYLKVDTSDDGLEASFDEYNPLNNELGQEYLRMYNLEYLIKEVIKREAPIHEELLFKRIAFITDKPKVNNQFREEILDNMPKDVYKSGDFYMMDTNMKIHLRIHFDREPQYIHPDELIDGVYKTVKKNKGISVDGCYRTIALLLNFDKITPNLRKALEAATLELKQRDLIFQKKESLFAKK